MMNEEKIRSIIREEVHNYMILLLSQTLDQSLDVNVVTAASEMLEVAESEYFEKELEL